MGLPPGAEQFRTLEGLNPEQRDAVATVGRHLAVEAGAGTGKTQVLTRRFVHLVLDHGVGVREILALTFTNRAAAQMQGRVRASFRERAAGDPDQAVRRRAQAALRELDSAYISTIHSFGARLLREFALEAGIDPRFRELDALEAEQLQFALADQLLAEWEADPARRQDFEALYGGVRWHRDTERPEAGEFAANFVRLYADVRCKTFGDLRFGQLVGPTDPPELQRALREAHGHFTAVAFSPSKANEKYRLWFELVQRLWQEASGAIAAGRYTEALALLHRIARESKQATNNELKPLKMFCSNDLVPLLAPWLLHQWGRPQRKALAHALLAFNASYQQAKDRLGVLDFGDLEHRAIALLQSRKSLRRLWRSRFKQVMVDEFQDTSPVQLELIRQLTGVGDPAAEGPRPAVFVVGDPKQSIYSFRQADLPAYDAFLDRDLQASEPFSLEGGPGTTAGTRLPLRHNYRSRAAVLDFVNATLLGRPREADPGMAPNSGRILFTPDATLQAAGQFNSVDPPAIDLLALDGSQAATEDVMAALPGGRWTKDDLEAHLLVAALKDLVDSRMPVTERGPGGPPDTRPVEWGDIACLVRSSATFRPIERACKRFGVPYFVQDGRGFFAAREVRDVLQLLKLLANPSDDVTCAGVLRGPLAGVSVEGLFLLTQATRFRTAGADDSPEAAVAVRARRASLWELLHQVPLDSRPGSVGEGLSDADRAACLQFRDLVADLRTRLALEPLPAVLEACYRTTDLPRVALRQEDGLRRYANLRKLQELAAGFPVGEHASLLQFVRVMEDYEDREARIGEAVVETPGGGAMVLLTIHAAKGEEYPVVVLPALGRQRRSRTPLWGFDRVLGLGLQIDPEGTGEWQQTAALLAVKAQRDQADRAEAHRLLYVALTRAKERLLLGGHIDFGRLQKKLSEGADWPDANSWLQEICLLYRIAEDADGERQLERGGFRAVVRQRATGQFHGALLHALEGALQEPGEGVPEPPADLVDAWRQAVNRLSRPVPPPDPLSPCFQVTELLHFHRCHAAHAFEHRFGIASKEDVIDALGGSADTPVPSRLLGQAFHRLMERIDWSNGADLPALVAAVAPEVVRHLPVREPAKLEAALVRMAQGFFASRRFTEEIKGAETVWRELPLVWHMPQDLREWHGRRVYFRGVADLVYRLPAGGWVILDYKTRLLDDEEEIGTVRDEFGLQLACYAEALRRRFPRGQEPPVTTVLLMPRKDGGMADIVVETDGYHLPSIVASFVETLRQSPGELEDLESWSKERFTLTPQCPRCGYFDLCPGVRKWGAPSA